MATAKLKLKTDVCTGDIFTIEGHDVMLVECDLQTYILIDLTQGVRFASPVFINDAKIDYIGELSVMRVTIGDFQKLVDRPNLNLIKILKTKRRM